MTDTRGSNPVALRAGLDAALALGRAASTSLRRLQYAVRDAQDAAQADLFWPMALLSMFSRVRRRRRIDQLIDAVQHELGALDAAADVLREHGLELPPPVGKARSPVGKSGLGVASDLDQWRGPLALVQNQMRRVDAMLGALRRLRQQALLPAITGIANVDRRCLDDNVS